MSYRNSPQPLDTATMLDKHKTRINTNGISRALPRSNTLLRWFMIIKDAIAFLENHILLLSSLKPFGLLNLRLHISGMK